MDGLPSSRPDPPHASPAAVRRRGLQLPPPAHLRGAGLPHSSGDFAVRARRGLRGRRVHVDEQRPRMQTRGAVVPLRKGDGVAFAVNTRPVRGGRGDYSVHRRDSVSQVRSGHRHTLGTSFHNAARTAKPPSPPRYGVGPADRLGS
ncbi:2OG-Fe(II) oxygenase [Nostoc sp. NIES-2111]